LSKTPSPLAWSAPDSSGTDLLFPRAKKFSLLENHPFFFSLDMDSFFLSLRAFPELGAASPLQRPPPRRSAVCAVFFFLRRRIFCLSRPAPSELFSVVLMAWPFPHWDFLQRGQNKVFQPLVPSGTCSILHFPRTFSLSGQTSFSPQCRLPYFIYVTNRPLRPMVWSVFFPKTKVLAVHPLSLFLMESLFRPLFLPIFGRFFSPLGLESPWRTSLVVLFLFFASTLHDATVLSFFWNVGKANTFSPDIFSLSVSLGCILSFLQKRPSRFTGAIFLWREFFKHESVISLLSVVRDYPPCVFISVDYLPCRLPFL